MKYFLTVFSLFAFFSLRAQDAYHTNLLDSLYKNFKLPKTAKWVLSNTEDGTFANAYSYGGKVTAFTPTAVPFSQAQQHIVTASTNPWDAGQRHGNTIEIKQGDRCMMVLWLRSTTPNAKVNIYVEHATNYTKEFFATVGITSTWRPYYVSFESSATYPAKILAMGLHLSYLNQTIEVGGMAFLNYEKSVIFSELPIDINSNGYDGSEATATWRNDAEQSIEKLRKANFNVKLNSPSGQMVNGATVRFEMLQHEFKFGSAVVSNKFNGGTAQDDMYEKKMLDLDGKGHGFNEIVFENDLKWQAWEEKWFSSHDELAQDMAWLKSKNISVRGHNLVWPGWGYSPKDVTSVSSPAFIKKRIRGHLESILNYPGVGKECIDWDVINELTDNNDYANRFAGSPGYVTGRELYAEIYKQADSLLPNSKLYVNDYVAIEQGNSSANWKSRIDELLAKGVKLDGLGFQGHFSATPTGIPRVKEILDDFWNKYQLEAKVTEYDISNLINKKIQANYMRDILTISFAHPSMKGFLMWGFWDGSHWLGNAPIYNKDWSLKPSGEAFVDQVFSKWWSDETRTASAWGEANIRGFKGKYKLTVTLPNGKTKSQYVDLEQDKTITVNVDVTATNELSAQFNLAIAPNPVHDFATITWDAQQSNDIATLQITNILGMTLFEKKVALSAGTTQIETVPQVAGTYFVTLKTKKGMQTKRMMVE
jgi:GH35 family endo-1,4-beta-xylanase